MTPEALTPEPPDRTRPAHCFFSEPNQYRAKVQRYSKAPPELTVRRVSFERDMERYHRAYENGQDRVTPSRRKRLPPETRDPEDIERARRRAQSKVRKLTTELAPNHFVTFTTREAGPDYFTPEDWRAIWARFIRLLHDASIPFQYVGVLEPHKDNPAHLHLHVAWRGRVNYKILRRFWHIAICGHRGQRVAKTLYGADAPGNIQDRPVKAGRGSCASIFKIAKYIAKYMTKDLISEYNKKRYWTSKGLTLSEAETFWLSELDHHQAIREAASRLGYWSDDHPGGVLATTLMVVAGEVAWARLDPEPPPF